MYKAVGFDMGGVIIYYYIPDLLRGLADHYGVEVGVAVEAHRLERPAVDVGEISVDEFWQRLIQRIKPGADPGETRHIWSERYVEHNPIGEGMLELVDSLHRRYKVGLLSNIDREHAQLNYGRGIFDHFDTVLLSDEVGVRKPDRAAYELLASKLETEPEATIFIDDNSENVKGAELAGMTGILFESRPQLVADLKRLGIDYS